MPIALTEEQRSLQVSVREWAKRTGTIELVPDWEARAAVRDAAGLPREESR